MKTKLTFLKSLVLLLAIGYATRASAQCQAGYTYTVNGGTIQFTNTSTFTTYGAYSWDFGDNTALDHSTNPSHMYSSAGTYNVCLTVSDSLNSCQNTYCSNVVATVGCGGFTVNVTSANPSSCSACDGSASASITGGTSPFAYLWSNSATTSSLSSACAGSYNVTVTDANNCIITGTANLACVPFDSCHPSFTHYVAGNSAYFTNNSGSDSLTAVFTWDFGDNTTFTGSNPWMHTYSQPGTYYVLLTVNDSTFNCSGTYGDSVTVGGPTSCGAYFTMVQDSFNLLEWYAYASVTGQAPFTYTWTFGDNSTSSLAYPTHNYSVSGQYTVCLSITDANGCNSSYCDSTSVHRIMSGQQMQYLITDPAPTGIHEQTTITQLSVWPNPTSDFINASLGEDVDGVMRITDILGNVVMEQKVNGRQLHVDVNSLPAGYYNMSVTSGTDNWNKKIVIIR